MYHPPVSSQLVPKSFRLFELGLLRPSPIGVVQRRHHNGTSVSPIKTNWITGSTQILSRKSLCHLFNNRVPDVKVPAFLSGDECRSLVNTIMTHEIGSYGEKVWPPIGSIGATQFDHQKDKPGYLAKVDAAYSLQDRFKRDTGIDILSRVQALLQSNSNLPVRIAREGDREYFAGLVRLINKSALLHADFGVFDGPTWEIGGVIAQITWNILLKNVPGGESVVYDRPWRGSEDDATFKYPAPSYGYKQSLVHDCCFKVMNYTEGDLHFFNSRNFHEVKPLPEGSMESRYTISSFVGLLPPNVLGGPALILWS